MLSNDVIGSRSVVAHDSMRTRGEAKEAGGTLNT